MEESSYLPPRAQALENFRIVSSRIHRDSAGAGYTLIRPPAIQTSGRFHAPIASLCRLIAVAFAGCGPQYILTATRQGHTGPALESNR